MSAETPPRHRLVLVHWERQPQTNRHKPCLQGTNDSEGLHRGCSLNMFRKPKAIFRRSVVEPDETFSTRSTGCRSCSGTRAEGRRKPTQLVTAMCDAFNEGGPRPRPSHLYIVRHVHGRRRSGHSPQHVSARRCHVSDHRAGPRGASQLWVAHGLLRRPPVGAPKRSHSARSTCTTWSSRNATFPLRSSSDCTPTWSGSTSTSSAATSTWL